MSAEQFALVGALVHRFRVLLPSLQQHLDDYEMLLPHVFMGDVTRRVLGEFRARGASTEVREILAFLEHHQHQGSAAEQELVAVSFVENLPRSWEKGGGAIRQLLGPSLLAQLRLME